MKFKLIHKVIIVLLIGLIISSLPFIIRSYNSDPMFYNPDLYQDLIQEPDSLFNHILLFFDGLLTADYLFLIPLLLGLVSLLFFFLLLKDVLEDDNKAALASVLFAFSPLFIYLFSTLSEYTFAIPFLLLFLYFIFRRSYWSIPFFILISLFDFSFLIISFFLSLLYLLFQREKRLLLANIVSGLIMVTASSLLFKGYLSIQFSSPNITSYFNIFGVGLGISFFYLCIGLLGFFTVWSRKPSYQYWLLSFAIILVLSLFNSVGKVFLVMYLSTLSALFIFFLLKRKWDISNLKGFILLLVACAVIFSTTAFIDNVVDAQPNKELVGALEYLEKQGGGVVFSHPDNSYFIEYFSGRKAFTMPGTPSEVADEIFYSRNLDSTSVLIVDNKIRYILITPDMTSGKVWSKEDEGLLFLFEHTDNFQRVYDVDGVEIKAFKLKV